MLNDCFLHAKQQVSQFIYEITLNVFFIWIVKFKQKLQLKIRNPAICWVKVEISTFKTSLMMQDRVIFNHSKK